jgi:hypothetical protein
MLWAYPVKGGRPFESTPDDVCVQTEAYTIAHFAKGLRAWEAEIYQKWPAIADQTSSAPTRETIAKLIAHLHCANPNCLGIMPLTEEELWEPLANRKWGLISTPTPTVLTSDTPVAIIPHWIGEKGEGFCSSDVLFPVSPQKLLVISDDSEDSFAYRLLTQSVNYNSAIAATASRFVFSSKLDLELADSICQWHEEGKRKS